MTEEEYLADMEECQRTIALMTRYIQRVELERDYYFNASTFAGIASTPIPKELEDIL